IALWRRTKRARLFGSRAPASSRSTRGSGRRWQISDSASSKCAVGGGGVSWSAGASLEPSDPRLGTALANFGLCLEQVGDGGGARLFGEALDVWRASGPWIARMDAPRMARSSLFHMRMELAHRETYRARWQIRWREMAEEAK